MPRADRATLYVELPPDLKAELEAFARSRGSTLSAETETALRRHLAHPPSPTAPAPLPPEAVPVPPRRPRGRPPKGQAG